MSLSTTFLGVPGTLQVPYIGIAIAATIYAGIFLMLSNHYIFRPKVEELLIHSSIQSKALSQLIVDLLSNLPQITFLACTIAISNSDSGLSVIVFSDLGWSGLYLGLLAFRGIANKQMGNWKLMLVKNIIFLCIIYATIALHYITQNYMISLGAILFLAYFINLLIDAQEEKFVSAMEYLFNYRPEHESNEQTSHSNKMVSLQYLAKHFPVSGQEVKQKMKSYDKEMKNIKIKTKSLVAQKLMKIALTVHLSRQKLQAKARRDIKNYYGTFNGTVAQRSRRIIVDKRTYDEVFDQTQENLRGDTVVEGQEVDSCIFYLFPVKLFESNKFLSVIFSLLINIGFGMLLSLTVFITDNLSNGQYAHIFYGIILLPFLPNASKADFFTSMSLSSLWKYCIFGLILCFNSLTSGSAIFSFAVSSSLTFSALIQLIALIILTFMIVTSEHSRYRIFFVWITAILINAIFIFKFS